MKKSFLILGIFFFIFAKPLFASSSYVLPYPSIMPGSIAYKIHVVWERILSLWYFGSFGQFEYNLKESDKYLVEAKTLFEYNQYLLGYKALENSDSYFVKVYPNLIHAQKQGKNITDNKLFLQQAIAKHIEILQKIKEEVPVTFLWTPEKSLPTNLDLHKAIDNSIQERKISL